MKIEVEAPEYLEWCHPDGHQYNFVVETESGKVAARSPMCRWKVGEGGQSASWSFLNPFRKDNKTNRWEAITKKEIKAQYADNIWAVEKRPDDFLIESLSNFLGVSKEKAEERLMCLVRKLSRETVDLRKCRPGQRCRTKDGRIATYDKYDPSFDERHPHYLILPHGQKDQRVTRTDDGKFLHGSLAPRDGDIVEILD